MPEDLGVPRGLRPQELEAVYAISRSIAQSVDVDAALDQIVKLTRPVFIFDNVILYHAQEDGQLTPSYARLIGRGRSAEADLAWGFTVAQETFRLAKTSLFQEKLTGWEQDRLNWRDFLGLPLHRSGRQVGVLVFGRFGGPLYTPDQIRLAEFIAAHISQLLEHQKLVDQVAHLEAERHLRILQEDFIANISHELRTPLGFIKGYATTLMREDAHWDEGTRREFLSYIDEETDRLSELIDDLLDSSRLQAGTMRMELRPLSLDQFLQEISMRALSRYPGLVMQLQVMPETIVSADPLRLAQVFENIISNAVKYAPGSPIVIDGKQEDSRVHVSLEDQGPGIAPDHLPHLFERFYRVQNKVHGTGLGLYISRAIIKAHGGEMNVESELAKGTTFHIYLPLHEDNQGNQTPQEVK
jgi:signal transduction histidine kinase